MLVGLKVRYVADGVGVVKAAFADRLGLLEAAC